MFAVEKTSLQALYVCCAYVWNVFWMYCKLLCLSIYTCSLVRCIFQTIYINMEVKLSVSIEISMDVKHADKKYQSMKIIGN